MAQPLPRKKLSRSLMPLSAFSHADVMDHVTLWIIHTEKVN